MEMKKIMTAGILAAALSINISGCGKGEHVHSEKGFPAADVSTITMDLSSWDVTVTASHDDKIHIEHKGKVKDTNEIQMTAKDGKLTIRQNAPEKNMIEQFSFGRAGKIELYIPEDCQIPLDIKNGAGDMELRTVRISDLNLDNDSGHISISGLTAQNITMDSVSGDIELTGSSCTDTQIQAESAYVTLKNMDIQSASISTSSGEVSVSHINTYDRLSIKTNTGDIALSHETTPDDLSYAISSGSDDVTIGFQNTEPTIDTDGCKQGSIGKGQGVLSVMSDSGTVVIK